MAKGMVITSELQEVVGLFIVKSLTPPTAAKERGKIYAAFTRDSVFHE